jgi:hypothetical protein
MLRAQHFCIRPVKNSSETRTCDAIAREHGYIFGHIKD